VKTKHTNSLNDLINMLCHNYPDSPEVIAYIALASKPKAYREEGKHLIDAVLKLEKK